ncbi:aa3-type cytochrome c oxidase subunit IV [Thermaurantiacus sp.]
MAELDKLPEQALGTWEKFLGLTKWAVILIAIILIGMAIFLT